MPIYAKARGFGIQRGISIFDIFLLGKDWQRSAASSLAGRCNCLISICLAGRK